MAVIDNQPVNPLYQKGNDESNKTTLIIAPANYTTYIKFCILLLRNKRFTQYDLK